MEQNYVTVTAYVYRALAERRTVKAKFHYTDPTGLCRRPARTNGVSRRSGSFGCARARVVESSYKAVDMRRWIGGSTPALHQHASALISIRPFSQLSVCLSVCLRDGRDWTENGSRPGTTRPTRAGRDASLHRTLSRRRISSSSSRHNEPMRCPAPQPADRPTFTPPGTCLPLEN